MSFVKSISGAMRFITGSMTDEERKRELKELIELEKRNKEIENRIIEEMKNAKKSKREQLHLFRDADECTDPEYYIYTCNVFHDSFLDD